MASDDGSGRERAFSELSSSLAFKPRPSGRKREKERQELSSAREGGEGRGERASDLAKMSENELLPPSAYSEMKERKKWRKRGKKRWINAPCCLGFFFSFSLLSLFVGVAPR